jgi:hypothetical protein
MVHIHHRLQLVFCKMNTIVSAEAQMSVNRESRLARSSVH